MCVSINVKRTKKRILYYKNSCITEIREARKEQLLLFFFFFAVSPLTPFDGFQEQKKKRTLCKAELL